MELMDSVQTRRRGDIASPVDKLQKSRRAGMKNKLMVALVLGCTCFAAVPCAHAQVAASKDSQTVTEQDVKLLRQDLRSQKKQLIAANLTLTDAESTKFWPVYDQFSAEMTTLGDQKYALIKEYAQNFGSLTDAQAQNLLNRSLALDAAATQLRIKYVPIVNKVLPGTKTATFFQMERRIST